MAKDRITVSTARELIASGKATKERILERFDVVDEAAAEPEQPTTSPASSVAERARQRLVSRGTSPERVKELAAAGQPVDENVMRVPTKSESLRSEVAGVGAGVVGGIAQLGGLAVDASIDMATAGPPRRFLSAAMKRLRGENVDWSRANQPPMPVTTKAGEATADAARTLSGWLGVDPNKVIVDVPLAAGQVIGEAISPAPAFGRARPRGVAGAADDVTAAAVRAGEDIAPVVDNAAPAAEKVGDVATLRQKLFEHDEAVRQAEQEHLAAIRAADEKMRSVEVTQNGRRPRNAVVEEGQSVEWMSPKRAVEMRRELTEPTAAKLRAAKAERDAFQESLAAEPTATARAADPPPEPPAAPPPDAPGSLEGAPAPTDPADAAASSRFNWYTKVREMVDDDWRRVKELVDDPKTTVPERANPYVAEKLYHGRAASRVEDVWSEVNTLDRDLVKSAQNARMDSRALQADVNTYLQARHAPERNAALQADGAAGMTDTEAAAALERITSSPHGAEVAKLADRWQALNNQTLDVLREGQLITEEFYQSLRAKYQNHAPLNRIMDDAADEAIGPLIAGRPMDVKSSGIRAARGSQREVADITANIVTNLEQAIIRAEKNRVNLATLEFSRANPDLGLFSESRPRAIGFRFDGETPIMQPRGNDPRILTLFEDGKAIDLHIKDPGLALALKGLGRYQVTGMFRAIQAYTRVMSNLATRFNLEFPLPNKIRDIQEAMIFAYSQEGIGAKGAAKIPARDLASMKDVLDGLRGADTPGARLYQQMRRDGGTTGGLGLSSRQAIEVNIDAIRQTNRSTPRLAARQIVQTIDALNQVVEDSTRLSVYKTALERGLGRERAAVLAKDASINFNKFGRLGPQVNALYMFANASIQGSVKMARAMKNPKIAATVTTAVGTAVFSTANWNDRIDPDWRSKVSKFDRLSTLPVVLPPSPDGSFNYIKIPVSWGIKPIKVAMDFASDAMAGKAEVSPGEAVATIAATTAESTNPVGGTDALSAATPTALDLPVDIARNRAWHGGMIGPDPAWDESKPESQRYFRNLPNTMTGAAAVATTDELSERGIEVSPADLKYAIDTLGGGSGRFATKVINTFTAIGKGETPDVNEIPIVSRFGEKITPERMEAMKTAQLREKAKKAEKEARRKIRQRQVAD